VAITLRQPARLAALPTRRVRNPSRASQLVLGVLISVVAAPWALLWRSDPVEQQLDGAEAGLHRGR
jgi:hypothetical protein